MKCDSNRARGDNLASLKYAVTNWLMERTPTPNSAIHRQDKSGQGFYNDVTGGLLCPGAIPGKGSVLACAITNLCLQSVQASI
jgi:hypothetical protein